MIYNASGTKILLIIFVDASTFNGTLNIILLHAIEAVELAFLLVSLMFQWIFIYILWTKATFHRNLMRLFLAFVSGHYLQQYGRLTLFLYQYNVFKLYESTIVDNLLIAICYCRCYVIGSVITLIISMVMERAFATYFIRDYEQRSRAWIFFTLFILQVVINAFMCFNFMRYAAENVELFAVAHVPIAAAGSIISLIAFIYMYRANKRRLNKLKVAYDQRKYSLSIRFQLEENVKALGMIKQAVICGVVCNTFTALVLVLPFLVFDINSMAGQLCFAAFDMFVAIYAIMMMITVLYTIEPWREEFLRILRKILFLKPKDLKQNMTTIRTTTNREESNIYFSQFQSAW